MTDRELMQQALEALELLAKHENPLTKIQVYKPRDAGQIVTMYPHKVATEAAAPLRERLAQPEQERWVWRNAAIRLGEELSSVGPVGYYDMTAAQWLDWAMSQEPRGKNSLAQPEQEPCGWQFYAAGKWHNGMEANDHRVNTEAAGIPTRNVYPGPVAQPEQERNVWRWHDLSLHDIKSAIEAKLKEKNT